MYILIRSKDIDYTNKENERINSLQMNEVRSQFKDLLRNHYYAVEEIDNTDFEDRLNSRIAGDQIIPLETWKELTGVN